MLLAVDTGNTNTIFAVFDGDELKAEWRIATSHHRTSDEYLVWLQAMMQHAGINFASINQGIIATVVPQALFEQRKLFKDCFKCEALVVGEAGVNLGVGVKVDNPSEVGADRLVNAYAAWQKYKQPLIVVDFGTATTFDVVDDSGSYIGGTIAPGIQLSLEALHHATAKLPNVTVARPARVIGKNTIEAMQSGIFYGYIGLIEGVIKRLTEEYGAPLLVLATGGLSPLFASGTPVIKQVEPDLTIRGLKAIFDLNE